MEVAVDPVLCGIKVREGGKVDAIQSAEPDLKEPVSGQVLVLLRQPDQDGDEPILGEDEEALLIVIIADPHGLEGQGHAVSMPSGQGRRIELADRLQGIQREP